MKTVSTKLDKRDHERLLQMCNEEGQSVAESLRDMIQMSCDAWEEGKEIEESNEDDHTKIEFVRPQAKLLRIFTCSNGNLYEDGVFVGSCSDYELRQGNVYKDDNQIGVIEN